MSQGKSAAWIRKQLEAAVDQVPDMPKQQENMQDENEELATWK